MAGGRGCCLGILIEAGLVGLVVAHLVSLLVAMPLLNSARQGTINQSISQPTNFKKTNLRKQRELLYFFSSSLDLLPTQPASQPEPDQIPPSFFSFLSFTINELPGTRIYIQQ